MELSEKIEKFFKELNLVIPPKPAIKLLPYRGEPTLFNSKLGGLPYMPKDFSYPTFVEIKKGKNKGKTEEKPLCFLAQLNFAELPQIENFPDKGILQFFIANDDLLGLNFKEPCKQDTFRIIYHENIITDESKLMDKEDLAKIITEDNYKDMPFTGEFAFRISTPELMPCVFSNYFFNDYATKAYNNAFGKEVKYLYGKKDSIEADDADFLDKAYGSKSSPNTMGTHIGGYPFFTQEDPRSNKKIYEKFNTLLLQIDSEGKHPNNIMWGDSGVANFFINSEDLKKKDFSNVLYNWDCY